MISPLKITAKHLNSSSHNKQLFSYLYYTHDRSADVERRINITSIHIHSVLVSLSSGEDKVNYEQFY